MKPLLLLVASVVGLFKREIPLTMSVSKKFSVWDPTRPQVWLQGRYYTTQQGYFQKKFHIEMNLMVSDKLMLTFPTNMMYLQLGVLTPGETFEDFKKKGGK